MGRSVLLYQGTSSSSSSSGGGGGMQQTNQLDSNNSSNNTVLNMDLMQKQQLQKRLLIRCSTLIRHQR